MTVKYSLLTVICAFLALTALVAASGSSRDNDLADVETEELPDPYYTNGNHHMDEDEEDPLSKKNSLAIKVYSYMPDNPFSMLVNEETTTLLLGIRNNEPVPLKIVALHGRFTQPGNYENVIRNVTKMPYYAELGSGEDITIAYRFRAVFQPGKVGLVVLVDLVSGSSKKSSSNQGFRIVGFQGDMTVDEPAPVSFDLQLVFVYAVMVVGVVAVALLVRYAFFSRKSLVKSPLLSGRRRLSSSSSSGSYHNNTSTSPTDDSQPSSATDNSWIPAEHLAAVQNSKTRKRNK